MILYVRLNRLSIAFALLLVSCGGGGGGTGAATPAAPVVPVASAVWAPVSSDTFQWDLADVPADLSANASVYDIDMVGADATIVARLHALGRHAVCYIDAGEWEPGRPDAAQFPAAVIGKKDPSWNEYFLDIRRLDVLGPLMAQRFDACKGKGFDAVEADQVDTFEAGAAVTGFDLSANDQLAYNQWLAGQAHQRGLSIALKNDGVQAAQLVGAFDWTLLEDCYALNTCTLSAPFSAAHKAIVDVEYTDLTTAATFTATDCPQARAAGIIMILKNRALDAWRAACS